MYVLPPLMTGHISWASLVQLGWKPLPMRDYPYDAIASASSHSTYMQQVVATHSLHNMQHQPALSMKVWYGVLLKLELEIVKFQLDLYIQSPANTSGTDSTSKRQPKRGPTIVLGCGSSGFFCKATQLVQKRKLLTLQTLRLLAHKDQSMDRSRNQLQSEHALEAL